MTDAARVEQLRAEVLASLAAHVPLDERERLDVERTMTEMTRLDDPFSIDTGPVHVTGSGFVVGRRGTILVRHKKLGLWLQPGGHVDAGEAPWEGARREVIEETGLPAQLLGASPELVHVSVHPLPPPIGHTHLDLRYLFAAGDADPSPPPEESQEVHWFSWPDAIATAEPDLTAILEHLAARFAPEV